MIRMQVQQQLEGGWLGGTHVIVDVYYASQRESVSSAACFKMHNTVEPLLMTTPDERPPSL